jgi:hypothetical protein
MRLRVRQILCMRNCVRLVKEKQLSDVGDEITRVRYNVERCAAVQDGSLEVDTRTTDS